MVLGAASETWSKTGIFTDEEVFRSWINPGFEGSFSWLEASISFNSGAGPSVSVTWKWQIRPKGQSSWTDLHTGITETWSSMSDKSTDIFFDAVAPNADDVPFEVRMVITNTVSSLITVVIDNTDIRFRVVGESV